MPACVHTHSSAVKTGRAHIVNVTVVRQATVMGAQLKSLWTVVISLLYTTYLRKV